MLDAWLQHCAHGAAKGCRKGLGMMPQQQAELERKVFHPFKQPSVGYGAEHPSWYVSGLDATGLPAALQLTGCMQMSAQSTGQSLIIH